MAFYSRLKNTIKSINNNLSGRVLLYIPLFIYFQSKSLGIRLSNLFYSYLYYYSSRLCRNNDLTIGIKRLGKNNTKFPHPVGIVIGKHVKIGYGCTIYQNVTIGVKAISDICERKYPKIGDNVIIGANTVIVGGIEIGDNVIIGAGSFVNKSIPNNVIVYGIPLKYRDKN